MQRPAAIGLAESAGRLMAQTSARFPSRHRLNLL